MKTPSELARQFLAALGDQKTVAADKVRAWLRAIASADGDAIDAAPKHDPAPVEASSLNIRWMIRRDMPSVLAIERASFDLAWSEEDFLCCLRQRNCIGMVAVNDDDRIVGFMLYELHKTRLRILNFAVLPACRRRGVGRAMFERLRTKLSQQRRSEIILDVRDSNLSAQQFFRACGFVATGVKRGAYEECRDDAYEFRFRLPLDDRLPRNVEAEA